jgi:hypothetical protein
MPRWEIVAIIAIVIAVALAAWLLLSQQRRRHLQTRFGPEYERTVRESGDRRRAERDLEQREKRVQQLHLHPLSPRHRDEFMDAWRKDQARFVDDPRGAVEEADHLVQEVMQRRGYPAAGFDRRLEDISVGHPHLAQSYRSAWEVAERNRRGEANTEELRKALVDYRALFEELLEAHEVTK